MDKTTHEMRLAQWTQIIHECRTSNMTVKDWCQENNINDKRFYYWQRRIRGKVYDTLQDTETSQQPHFVQLPVSADSAAHTSSFTADMVIHIGNNVLEISNTASEELLSKVLKVMAYAK